MSDRILDPQTLLVDAALPLERGPLLALVTLLLARVPDDAPLPVRDYEQIALLLNGHARAVLASVNARRAGLPVGGPAQHLTSVVVAEAERRLSAPPRGTLHCVQHRARLVRALYERLDRLGAEPQPLYAASSLGDIAR
ncbi:hypothetical protein RVR_P1201 (plasmid) [Actinacidiphila reveromycinica]|uniref:Uncharacterized protein n=1 Tax=Actinacidiphila reveromycinica TaxID=659352 RepID=A0A7R6QHV5_9ACTN|nr:restriction endonuclease [Streptomyces sp. SN-593]BBG20655.1 hypothetical protein RVR_P1201 [Streptomyces sp. SN-593]